MRCFEDVGGWVRDACVDVARLLQGKESHSPLGALQIICGGLIDGNGFAPCGGVGGDSLRGVGGW